MKGKNSLILLLVVIIALALSAVAFRGVVRVKTSGYTYDIGSDGNIQLDENGQPQLKEVTQEVTVESGRFDSGRPVRYGSYRNIKQGLDLKGGVYIIYEAKDTNGNVFDPTGEQMAAAVSMLQTRVDDKGYYDAEVSQEGTNRIRVEIPGVTDAQATAQEIGEAAHLTFKDADGNVLVDGANVANATKQTQNNEVVVSLEFDSKGAQDFASATQANVGKQIGIYMDETLISNPTVNTAITDGKAVIQGNFDAQSADDLAAKIRAGSLPFNLNILEYNAVGARLGADSLSTSVKAGILGVAIVLLFMLIVYRIPGLAADIALVIYTALLVVIMSLMGTTLTLPGLAGIVLSIGMAVDANVIIFERIKEEVNAGKAVKSAVRNGFSKALSAILDGNITTLISCVILYWLGTGPVKGFAMTLFLGIVVSMFTALVITRIIINALVGVGINGKKLYGGK